ASRCLHSFPTRRSSDLPVLLPAYADLWSHTSPIPNADPEVALFLHGPDRSPASVQIVWRADIHRRDLVSAERERAWFSFRGGYRSEEHTSELQSPYDLV